MNKLELDAMHDAIGEILLERGRQNEKWGIQNHQAGIWALVLLEELGEWAKAELHNIFGGEEAGRETEEMIQVSAVAMAIVECQLRKKSIKSSMDSLTVSVDTCPDQEVDLDSSCGE